MEVSKMKSERMWKMKADVSMESYVKTISLFNQVGN